MDRSGEFIERARTQVDRSCYLWGATGQDLCAVKNLESYVRSKETTGDGETRNRNVQRVLQRYQKLRNKGQTTILCFDCSGFIYWDFKHFNGLISGRRAAAGLYSLCKEKKTRGTLRAGDLVFVWNGSKISHVGLYAGDDHVIHCKGRDVGVIEELISRHGWNRYGRWPGMYDDDPPEPPEPGHAYVVSIGTLNIRTGPGTQYKAVGVSKNGERFLWLGDDPMTGWHAIEYDGSAAWITGKPQYTKVVPE